MPLTKKLVNFALCIKRETKGNRQQLRGKSHRGRAAVIITLNNEQQVMTKEDLRIRQHKESTK